MAEIKENKIIFNTDEVDKSMECENNKIENIENMHFSEFVEKYMRLKLLPYQKVYLDYLHTHPYTKVILPRHNQRNVLYYMLYKYDELFS